MKRPGVFPIIDGSPELQQFLFEFYYNTRVSSRLQSIYNLTKAGVSIYLHSPGIYTLNPDGTKNPLTTMLVAMLSSFAEMEREQIRYRLESGRKLAIERGVKMGRKPGFKMSDKKLLERYPQVVRKLKKGLSIREIAGACNVSTTTVQKVKKAIYPERKHGFEKSI